MDWIWDYRDFRAYFQKVRDGMPPLIIGVAITGGIHGKEVNPNLPETPEEQAQTTFECYQAGASIVHVHARDPNKGFASPSINPDDYRKINALIREKSPEIIINNTCGAGVTEAPLEEIVRSLEANPEMASLDFGPLNFRFTLKKRLPPLSGRDEDVDTEVILPFTFKSTEFFAKKMLEKDVKPELEIFDLGDYWQLDNLIRKNLVKKPYFCQFVMGFQKGIHATPKNVILMMESSPPDSLFEVLGVGVNQLYMNVMGIILGGHVRVGMEDNVFYNKGELCQSNAQQVERVVRLARELGREVATPQQARQMLGISERPKQYQ